MPPMSLSSPVSAAAVVVPVTGNLFATAPNPEAAAEAPTRAAESLLQRFEAKVERDAATGCWNWTGSRCKEGYGRFQTPGGTLAHRFAYQHFVGPIPPKFVIDHLCRNRGCVNPRHLEPVRQRTNILRGVSPAARRAVADCCDRGHPWTAESTYTYKGQRRCRVCKRARDQLDRLARRAPKKKTHTCV